MGLQITKDRLNDKTISDRWIKFFIKQCPCFQVTSRAHVAIRTHPSTCAAYYPFEVIALTTSDLWSSMKKATSMYWYLSMHSHVG